MSSVLEAIEPAEIVAPAGRLNPATAFLAAQSPEARRGMLRSLAHVSEIAARGVDPEMVPWWELRRPHCATIRARLVESGLAVSTINHRLSALRGVLKEAWRSGRLTGDDHASCLDALKKVRGERPPAGRHVSQSELVKVFRSLAARPGPSARKDAAVIAVLAGVAPRCAEVAALDLSSWKPTEQVLQFRTKGLHTRAVPVGLGAQAALNAWLNARGRQPGPLFLRVRHGGWVTDDRLSTNAVRRTLARWAQRAGVEPFTPHDLRRTLVGEMLDAGVDLAAVQRYVGHQDPKTTARYDRRHERVLREAAARVTVPYIDPEEA